MRIEFYKDRTGVFKPVIYFKFDGQIWEPFENLTPEQIEIIFFRVCEFHEAKRALLSLSKFFPGDKRSILRQFIECNWLELDDRIDITDAALNYEYVPCPRRNAGTCEWGAEICMKHGL